MLKSVFALAALVSLGASASASSPYLSVNDLFASTPSAAKGSVSNVTELDRERRPGGGRPGNGHGGGNGNGAGGNGSR